MLERMVERFDIHEDGSVKFNELTIREYGVAEDDKELSEWGSRLPVTADTKDLIAYGIPRSYGVRPSLYKNSFVSAGFVEDRLVGASGLCGKKIFYNGNIVDIFYGIDGIIHPDFRSKGYVNLIGLRNSIAAAKKNINSEAFYGSVTATNIPSIRACENSGMKKLFQYDRLMMNISENNFFNGLQPSGKNIRVHRDPINTARLLSKYFGSSNFFPVDAVEITSNRPFLGTVSLNENTDRCAMVSIWDMCYTFSLQGMDGSEKRAYFLFGGVGKVEELAELIKHLGAWASIKSKKDTYLVINTNSPSDPLAQAFYKVAPSPDKIKGFPYLYYVADRTKDKLLSSNSSTYNPAKEDKSTDDTIEHLFDEPQEQTERHTFFDPRDNGILLVPKSSVVDNPLNFVTSSLITTSSKL